MLKRKKATLVNKWGLHARTAFALASEAMRYESVITVEKKGVMADCKRIDELLLLTAACGDSVSITAEGPDEDKAAEALTAMIESGFGEKQ